MVSATQDAKMVFICFIFLNLRPLRDLPNQEPVPQKLITNDFGTGWGMVRIVETMTQDPE